MSKYSVADFFNRWTIRVKKRSTAYVVALRQQRDTWLLYDIDGRDTDFKQVTWTRDKYDAIHFATIHEAREIIDRFLSDRKYLVVLDLADI